MDTPFPAYSGDQPYVFVCYAHADSDIVYPEMVWLREQGTNLWYDEGISAGKNWRWKQNGFATCHSAAMVSQVMSIPRDTTVWVGWCLLTTNRYQSSAGPSSVWRTHSTVLATSLAHLNCLLEHPATHPMLYQRIERWGSGPSNTSLQDHCSGAARQSLFDSCILRPSR